VTGRARELAAKPRIGALTNLHVASVDHGEYVLVGQVGAVWKASKFSTEDGVLTPRGDTSGKGVVLADPVNSTGGIYVFTYDESGRRAVRLTDFKGTGNPTKDL